MHSPNALCYFCDENYSHNNMEAVTKSHIDVDILNGADVGKRVVKLPEVSVAM